MPKSAKILSALQKLQVTYKIVLIAVFVVGMLVYGNSLFNEFAFDDQFLITVSNKYHSLSNIPGFFLGYDPAKSNNNALYYRPVAYTIETINYFLFHQSQFFYRAERILIHIVNSF